MKVAKIASAMLLGGLISTGAHATNGYFASGYGIQSQGMGGVSIAFPQDSLAAASNPASIGFLGDRLDVGVTYFQPNRSATLSNSNMGAMGNGSYDGNGTKSFWIPEFGITKAINKQFSVGLNVFGNGGMNTNYTARIPQFNMANNNTPGVNLEQMFISPTVSWKPVESQSLGVSLIYVNQNFSATGLANFAAPAPYNASSSPSNVTDNGKSSSTGFGYQLGWLGKFTDYLSVGVRYQPKISMSSFGSYSGLFAGGGSFDIPETYGAGLAFNPTKDITLAADYQNIKYGNVPSIANPIGSINQGVLLGSANGAGFGWQNINVYKLGANWRINPSWAVRVGYNFNDQPIPSSQTLFNVLAPGVITQQASIGATYYIGKEYEISGFYARGFSQTVTGNYSAAGMTGTSSINMYQDSVGLAFGWKY